MKDLEFIRKHVKIWPEGAKTVRLDKDGEICFIGENSSTDFYPDGYDLGMFNGAEGCLVTGEEYTHDEWVYINEGDAMRYTLDKSKSIESYGETLFNVLDNGVVTYAYALDDVEFSDKCEVSDGVFHGGEFRGGVFHGGEFRGGVFHGGEFRGGEFRGGVFRDGEFHGGWFHGGVFHGGVFHGGVFHDGWFHGGVFHDGWFHGGWLILQIQGSKHFVNIPDGKNIKIGCQCHDVDWWLSNYERIGRIEGYSDAQIAEYKMYIDIAAEMIRNENQN